ncbi:hypothetical protein [Geobacillus sp. TFV-3]|uniref:hypothetical protein n=1 Tax=Geobacillus sp. TFV-3 TaxID=1897059 RepID=UPI001F3FFFB0|nr:hypothetical protein [Geobacillus sp. TFV-3]KAF0993801.1 hypothetical protein BJQ97_00426 [Geobacillus sp. TFV-3]
MTMGLSMPLWMLIVYRGLGIATFVAGVVTLITGTIRHSYSFAVVLAMPLFFLNNRSRGSASMNSAIGSNPSSKGNGGRGCRSLFSFT